MKENTLRSLPPSTPWVASFKSKARFLIHTCFILIEKKHHMDPESNSFQHLKAIREWNAH